MAVAELPPKCVSTFQDVCPFYELEGDSGRELIDRFGIAILQWQNRPSILIDSIAETESDSHLQFRKAGTMRVRFKMAGAMQPRVIEIAEAVEE